jgi:hypothetical protein
METSGIHGRRVLAALGGAGALLLLAGPAVAQVEPVTEHNHIEITDPAFIGPCDGSPGLLEVEGEEVFHLTDTGRTLQVSVTTHVSFTFDPYADGLSTATGRAVLRHQENVNYAQLADWRVTDATHSIAFFDDGTSQPVQIVTTVLFAADGGIDVKIDSIRCGGQLVP